MRQLKSEPTPEQRERWEEFFRLCSQVPESDTGESRLKKIAKMCGCAHQTVRLWHSGHGTGQPNKGKYYPPSNIVLAAFRANLELAKMKGEL